MKGVGDVIPRSFIVVFLGAATCWVASTVANRAAKSCSCWGEKDDDEAMVDCEFEDVCIKPKAVEVEASGVVGSKILVGAGERTEGSLLVGFGYRWVCF